MKRRRKKTLKQWAAFGRRGMRKRTYKDNRRLHEYEHAIILRDAIALGGASFDAYTLDEHYPGRYDIATLKAAMKRMQQEKLLKWSTWKVVGSFARKRGPFYTVREEIRAQAA